MVERLNVGDLHTIGRDEGLGAFDQSGYNFWLTHSGSHFNSSSPLIGRPFLPSKACILFRIIDQTSACFITNPV